MSPARRRCRMAIAGAQRNTGLVPGTRLVAKYKGKLHTAEVVAAEDGKIAFRLADGQTFKSPSAAGSAVMGGTACNGWRWWSVEGAEPAQRAAAPPRAARSAPETPDEATPKARPTCGRCGKSFVGAKQLAHH